VVEKLLDLRGVRSPNAVCRHSVVHRKADTQALRAGARIASTREITAVTS
jgi:hypothetical protein